MAQPVRARVLVVDDDSEVRNVLAITLTEEGYEAQTCDSVAAALRTVAGAPDLELVLTDLRMPGADGIALLKEIRLSRPGLPVILMTAYGGIDEAVEAVKAGADDFLQKPILPELLIARVASVLDGARLRRRVADLESDRVRTAIPCAAPLMVEFVARLPVLAKSDCTVLVRGETGTGKELVARTLHDLSGRARGPFTAVNCGGIPEELFEAELFGHARGAFTGADRERAGLIAETDGGTLFLDEVGDLPYAMQVKVLRILEDGEIRQIGRTTSRKVDVRVVAATNVDLEKAVESRAFRQDLYYRLNTLELFLPPLRERPEDIALLANHFLDEIARKEGRPRQSLSPEALAACTAHAWPGNVRELKNRLRAASLFSGPTIERSDLRLAARSEPGATASEAAAPEAAPAEAATSERAAPLAFREARHLFEKRFIEEALRRSRGNVFKAAGETGISRRQLYDMMKALGIEPAAFRDADPS